MVVMETFFDFLSASAGAILGALFAFMLNRKRNKKMSSQLVVSRQSFEKIKLENMNLLQQIKEKENLILQLQLQILGKTANSKSQSASKKTKDKI